MSSVLQTKIKLFVFLDKSGSMGPGTIWNNTITSVSDFIFRKKNIFPNGELTIITFNDEVELYSKQQLSTFNGLSPGNIIPDGLTALYDAIIQTFKDFEINSDERIFVIIITDGKDNRSKPDSQKKAFDRIDELKKNGVEIVYLGLNIDSWTESQKIGVPLRRNVTDITFEPVLRTLSDNIHEMVRTNTGSGENPEMMRAYTAPPKVPERTEEKTKEEDEEDEEDDTFSEEMLLLPATIPLRRQYTECGK